MIEELRVVTLMPGFLNGREKPCLFCGEEKHLFLLHLAEMRFERLIHL